MATRGDATRLALLDAAITRFARDGYRATSVTDIARDADVGDTTAYVHHRNKEALFLAAVDADVSALFAEVLVAVGKLAPSSSYARRLLGAVLDAVDRHPLAGRLLAGREPSITARALESQAIDTLTSDLQSRLRDMRSAGKLRPDVSTKALADGLVALVIATTMASVQTDGAFLDRFGRGLTALFQTALVPDPRTRPARPTNEPATNPTTRPIRPTNRSTPRKRTT